MPGLFCHFISAIKHSSEHLEPCQDSMKNSSDQDSKGKYKSGDNGSGFHASFLDYHEEICNAGDEESDGNHAHHYLLSIKHPTIIQLKQSCCSEVPSEKTNNKGFCSLGRQAKDAYN